MRMFWKADEVADIVDQYMKYHAELVGARIACVFKEKATMSDGRPLVGKIGKVPPKYQPLMEEEFDYLIEVGADAWAELDNAQKEAWVDHILEHAYGSENEKTGEMAWKLRTPELVGFPCVINRHGVSWMQGLAKIATLSLPKTTSIDPVKRESASAMTDVSDDPFDLD